MYNFDVLVWKFL